MKSHGFTLMEVLVALGICMLGIQLCVELQNICAHNLRRTNALIEKNAALQTQWETTLATGGEPCPEDLHF